MNEFSDQNPDSKAETKSSYETFTEAIDAGKSDAAEKAREAFPDLKEGVANAMHDLAYGMIFERSRCGEGGR